MAIGDEKVIDVRPADLLEPEMYNIRKDIGKLAKSDEDVLTYAMFPDTGRKFLEEREEGTLQPEQLIPVSEAGKTGDQVTPTEFNITVHGETYHIKLTGAGHKQDDERPIYLSVDGVPEEILVESLAEISAHGSSDENESGSGKRPKATKEGHVTSSMPGTVVDVLVKEGATVKAGDAVLVVEAMKMENEVPAPVAGTVKSINVAKGESVTPDDALIEIE